MDQLASAAGLTRLWRDLIESDYGLSDEQMKAQKVNVLRLDDAANRLVTALNGQAALIDGSRIDPGHGRRIVRRVHWGSMNRFHAGVPAKWMGSPGNPVRFIFQSLGFVEATAHMGLMHMTPPWPRHASKHPGFSPINPDTWQEGVPENYADELFVWLEAGNSQHPPQ